MNKDKRSSLVRLIAFFLVALILVCTFGFTADGWNMNDKVVSGQNKDNKPTLPDNGVDSGENQPSAPENKPPEFLNPLTGLETTEELSQQRPQAFLMNPDSPLYGSSFSEILVEIPVENGKTRLMAIMSDTSNLWKLGSLSPTRAYISNVAKFFGASIISLGKDESIQYNSCDASKDTLDLSLNKEHYYSEYTYYTYTNANLLNTAFSSSDIEMQISKEVKLPFIHNDYFANEIENSNIAKNISVIYSSASITEFIFSEERGTYILQKNGVACKDLLTNTNHEFKNCFILFADSVTYEGVNGEQTVINTIGEGSGFYFTNGSCTKIKWESDADGTLRFLNTEGSTLTINRGTSYVAYVKSSRTDSVIYE